MRIRRIVGFFSGLVELLLRVIQLRFRLLHLPTGGIDPALPGVELLQGGVERGNRIRLLSIELFQGSVERGDTKIRLGKPLLERRPLRLRRINGVECGLQLLDLLQILRRGIFQRQKRLQLHDRRIFRCQQFVDFIDRCAQLRLCGKQGRALLLQFRPCGGKLLLRLLPGGVELRLAAVQLPLTGGKCALRICQLLPAGRNFILRFCKLTVNGSADALVQRIDPLLVKQHLDAFLDHPAGGHGGDALDALQLREKRILHQCRQRRRRIAFACDGGHIDGQHVRVDFQNIRLADGIAPGGAELIELFPDIHCGRIHVCIL